MSSFTESEIRTNIENLKKVYSEIVLTGGTVSATVDGIAQTFRRPAAILIEIRRNEKLLNIVLGRRPRRIVVR